MPIIRRYSRMYTAIQPYVYSNWYLRFFLDYCLLSCLDWNLVQLSVFLVGMESNPKRKTDSHPKRIVSTDCCIYTVVPPDDGFRYAWNMYRLTKHTKNKLCIKLVFLYTIISRRTVNRTYHYFLSTFVKHTAWWWLPCTAETFSYFRLTLIYICVLIDCILNVINLL
jgi:hypothetical protein